MPDLVALLAERKRLLACPWKEFDSVRLADIDDMLIAAIPDLLERCGSARPPVVPPFETAPRN